MGRRSRKYVCGGYIADGFVNDCEELIQRCMRAEILNYHIFCNIWKDMNFAQLYHGRSLGSELAELSEEVIFVAKRFLINSDNMEESIAALFLVYALLNLQPYKRFAPLRVIPDDIVAIKRIEQAARCDKRYDVLYILGSILIEGPVEYHAQPRDYGFEMSIKKYMTGFCGPEVSSLKPKGVFSVNNEELELLREMNSLSKKYSDAKSALTKSGMWTEKLNYSNDKLASELEASYRKVLAGPFRKESRIEGENSSHDSDDDEDAADHLRAIKNKAMAIAEPVSKHRIGVLEKRKKMETKNNPVSPRPTTSKAKSKKKKPALAPKLRAKQRFLVPLSEESSDSDSDILPSSSNETDSPELSSKKEKIKQLDTEILQTQNEIKIQLNSLPVIISVDPNKEYEIEIIDQMKPVEPSEESEINKNEHIENKTANIDANKNLKKEHQNKRKNAKSKSKGKVERDSPETKKMKRKVSIENDAVDPKSPPTRTSPRTKPKAKEIKNRNKEKKVTKNKSEGSIKEPSSINKLK